MKKKAIKTEKIQFKKFTVIELNNLKTIVGGIDTKNNPKQPPTFSNTITTVKTQATKISEGENIEINFFNSKN